MKHKPLGEEVGVVRSTFTLG